jgi:hypothetical protein
VKWILVNHLKPETQNWNHELINLPFKLSFRSVDGDEHDVNLSGGDDTFWSTSMATTMT